MSITGAIVLFVVIWFMTMFVVLPIRARSQAEDGNVVPGTHEGAPANFRLRRMSSRTFSSSAVLRARIWRRRPRTGRTKAALARTKFQRQPENKAPSLLGGAGANRKRKYTPTAVMIVRKSTMRRPWWVRGDNEAKSSRSTATCCSPSRE